MRALEALSVAVALSGLLLGCKSELSSQQQAQQADRRAAQLAKEARAAVAAQSSAAKASAAKDGLRDFQQALQDQLRPDLEPVPAATLQALLPKALPDMEPVAAVDAAPSSGALNISTASAHFRNPKGTLSLQIADIGSLKAFADLADTGWSKAKIDRETAEGHERTLSFEGFQAYEQSQRRSGAHSLKLLIKKRFMVQAQSQGLSPEQLKVAARKIDLQGLAGLAAHGVRSPAAK